MITAKECIKGLISFFLGVLGIFLIQFSGLIVYCTETPDELTFWETFGLIGLALLFLVPGLYLLKKNC